MQLCPVFLLWPAQFCPVFFIVWTAGTLLLAHALLSCGKLVRVHLLRMLLQWTVTFEMFE
jgi:hypothetical protein